MIISLIFNAFLFLVILLLLYLKKQNTPSTEIESRLKALDTIQTQVENLNSLFTLPYIRGGTGETLLEELIKNWLPPGAYEFQYPFHSGNRVDAIIRTGKYIIPVDSKFPLQSLGEFPETGNISPRVKNVFLKHARDISERYILPGEGTMNFALMYIPSERIYYSAFAADKGDLTQALLKIGIIPASPSTLFLFLQTVVYGLKGFTFSRRQEEILKAIEELKHNYTGLKRQWELTATHMKNMNKSWDEMGRLLEKSQRAIPEIQDQPLSQK